ncbi:MAG: phosphoenolpyruvate--protein phosphotransferase, partial [Calditrichales bacterium]|nr:phosphoenolpyruvate--protein phosphotransferase [Calditrichales bacterium]
MKNNTKIKNKEIFLEGAATSPGIAIGPVFLFRPFSIDFSKLETKIENIRQEFLLFEKAKRIVLNQLEFAQINSEVNYGSQFSDIFESQKSFLHDPDLINEIKQEIKNSKHCAAYVISKILSQKSDYFINLENIYFRERAFDITDLKQKLIYAMLGIDIDYQLSTPSIVIAESLSPSDTINFNRNFILGFLTDKGGKTSHAAIMARGLRIPAVVNGKNLSKIISKNSTVIIDGFSGSIILNPKKETSAHYEKLQKEYQRFEKDLFTKIDKPAVTKDRRSIQLLANIEFIHEVTDAKLNRAEGIGLFRTESIFIEKKAEPSEESQFKIYKKLARQMQPGQVVIRTIDLGGDKLIEGYGPENELNPNLGWRAIRFCLDSPDVFKTQLRAIYRASVFGNVKILIPMISSVDEIMQTKELIKEVQRELMERDISFKSDVPLGIMIETPAAAVSAKFLAGYVDYFSIGTNDLTQYVLAIDRTNDRVSKSYNTFNPS